MPETTAIAPATYPWTIVAPAGSQVIAVPGDAVGRGDVLAQMRAMPSGSTVMLLDGRPGSRRRLRVLARAAAVEIEHEYVVLPTLRSAFVIVDDTPTTVAWLYGSVLTVPPGTTLLAAPVDLAIRLLRRLAPWWLLGVIAPGRALMGRLA